MDALDVVFQFLNFLPQRRIFLFEDLVVPQHRFLGPQWKKLFCQPISQWVIPPLLVCAKHLRKNNECRP